MLNAKILYEVLGLAQVPHLDIEVVAAGEQRRSEVLNETCTGNRVDNLTVCVRL